MAAAGGGGSAATAVGGTANATSPATSQDLAAMTESTTDLGTGGSSAEPEAPVATNGGAATDADGGAAGAVAGTGGDAAAPADELELSGDAPQQVATFGRDDFELLPDTDEFGTYNQNVGNMFEISPLADSNFPPGFCGMAQSDEELNEAQQWSRAEVSFDGKTWYYDLTLTLLPEEDGESPYQVLVAGEVVGEFEAPPTGNGIQDRQDYDHTFERIAVRQGDAIEVRSKAHSNLEVTEGAVCRNFSPTYAWSRGRWRRISLEASPEAR